MSNVAAWQAGPLEAFTEVSYHASIFHLSQPARLLLNIPEQPNAHVDPERKAIKVVLFTDKLTRSLILQTFPVEGGRLEQQSRQRRGELSIKRVTSKMATSAAH